MKKYIDADALLCEVDGLFRDMATALYDSQDDAIEAAEVSIRQIIHSMPYADVEPAKRWISADKPPDNGRPVFIAYRNKNDKSDINIDISRWCEIRLGGQPTGEMHWFPPYEYFTSNYEVFAWQDLPEPPKTDGGSK